MLHPLIRAKEDNVIHGSGLVATGTIRAGEIVSRLEPNQRIILLSDVLRMSRDKQQEILHIAYQNSETTMVIESGDERFMNHSCDPNTWWADDNTMVACRDIYAGEEVTYDYATTEIIIPDDMECFCGSSICRGHVTNLDYLDPTWQQRYAEHLPTHTLSAIARANAVKLI